MQLLQPGQDMPFWASQSSGRSAENTCITFTYKVILIHPRLRISFQVTISLQQITQFIQGNVIFCKLSPRLFSCNGFLDGLPWFAQSNSVLTLSSPSQREQPFSEQQRRRGHWRSPERGRGSCQQRERVHSCPPQVSSAQHTQHDCRSQQGKYSDVELTSSTADTKQDDLAVVCPDLQPRKDKPCFFLDLVSSLILLGPVKICT